MSRRWKILRNVAIALAALLVVVIAAALIVVHTEWFHNYALQKIVAKIEEGTGGRTEIGSFEFDPTRLHARITGLVIHGTEPPDAAPFVRVAAVDLYARALSQGRIVGISYLGIEQPAVNVMVFPDGRTNLPAPKPSAPSKEAPLQSVVDLAVSRLDLSGGVVNYNSHPQALDVRASQVRAQLWYHLLRHDYQGQLSLQPIYVVSGRNTPVTMSVTLPLTLESDAVRLHDARITTQDSSIRIEGAIENLRQPRISAQVSGRVALADLKNAGNLDLQSRPGLDAINLDADATISNDNIRVSTLKVSVGNSNLSASGVLRDPRGAGSMHFEGDLALAELARLAGEKARVGGSVRLSGEAKLDANSRYDVSSRVAAGNLAFEQGTTRIRQASLSADVELTPERVDLRGLRLAAFGGRIEGDGALDHFERYRFSGNLRSIDLQQAFVALGDRPPYDGVISGSLQASGDLSKPGTRSVEARAALGIAPGRRGIPLQGRLRLDYSGAHDDVAVENSYLALPHTRLTMTGSIRRGLEIAMTTSDLRDFPGAPSTVTFLGGRAGFRGVVSGALSSPQIAGHLAVTHFQVEGRQFDALNLDAQASSSRAAVSNGSLIRGAMQAAFSANVGLKSWSPEPFEPVAADATIRNGDVADMMAMAGAPSQDYSGALAADLHVAGTVGNPSGSAVIRASSGTLHGEPFDRLDAQVNLADQLATIPSAALQSGSARVDLSAEFRHPRDSFNSGRIHARVQTTAIDLARVRTLQQPGANLSGSVQLHADVTADLSRSEFMLTTVSADASARGLQLQGQPYGDAQLQARTSGQTATLNLTSDFAGSSIRMQGTAQLVRGYPASADVQVSSLPIERVLAIAHRTDIPVKGKLAANARVHGTLDNPEGDGTIDVTGATAYGDAIDRAHAQIDYHAQRIDVPELDVTSGPSHIKLSAQFDHPAGKFDSGNLQFRVDNSHIDLAHLHAVEQARPGLSGAVQLAADGAVTLQPQSPGFLITRLNADLAASNLAANRQPLGSLKLAAHTTSGNRLDFTLDSDIAGSSIKASGNGQLGGDYPVTAQLSFDNVRWTRLAPLVGASASGTISSFDATTAGKISVNGPMLRTDQLRASLEVPTLQIQTRPPAGAGRPITIQNQGPLTATLDRGTVRIENFHFSGPQTDIQAGGTYALATQRLDVRLNAGIGLKVLENFSRDITSSGNIKVSAAVRGTADDPQTQGQVELENATLNYATIPNGLANANGVVLLRGNRAAIQKLTAESGGGTITLSGFAALSGNAPFALRAKAAGVRVRVQEGVSIQGSADVNITGTSRRSTASGTVTLEQINYATKSDLGAILERAAPPVQTSPTPSPLLDNMKLDVRVRTSPATRVQASLAENVQMDADLRVRGSASTPAVLGRINLNEGRLIFFGTSYTINTGSISFYNAARIQPVLNISLETQAKGVDVTLNVTGPVDNMKLTYTSNPPLQFQEIVGLLSVGTVPTSDPTLLANQPTEPAQTFEQRGESAVLSEAVANPVAGRLQRVFGVTQLKIDPAFTGSSQLPTAQVTLQQQVSNNLTFTYVSELDNPNSTLVRAEWALSQRWSATAVRDQNGIFSINLLYKKQFR